MISASCTISSKVNTAKIRSLRPISKQTKCGKISASISTPSPGSTTEDMYRGVFNTGAEVSFKASRLWPDVRSSAFAVDGLRHIVEPSANYVFVPNPKYSETNMVPQFDYELPSLRLLPIEF